MGAILSFFRPAPVARGDWSQQEIAEFYRVEAALTQAGLRVTTDRGLSDEDDPWFVFCRFDGDVILHFARIDDLYVVASEAFEHPLQGPDFRALLNAVAAEHPTLVPLPRPDANGARGNLVLHPAALLAAIVATVAFQLAGGDAMASEFATDTDIQPMLQPGVTGPDGGSSFFDGPGGDKYAFSPKMEGEHAIDEGDRQARHALILSALALISVTLPGDQTTDPNPLVFLESSATGASDKFVIKQASEADIARESTLAQKRTGTSLDMTVVESAAESVGLARVGLVLTSVSQTPANVEGLNLAALNILGLGGAGGQEITAMRAAESTPAITVVFGIRSAIRTPSVAVLVEKAAPPASAVESAPTTSSNAPHAAASLTASPATANAQSAVNTTASSDLSGGGSHAIGGALSAAAGSVSVKTPVPFEGSPTAAAVVASGTATAAPSVTAPVVQPTNTPPVTITANIATRTVLNAFIDQLSSTGSTGGTSDTGSAVRFQATDPWFSHWAKTIGTRTASDILNSLISYTVKSSTLLTASVADLNNSMPAGTATAPQISGGTSTVAGLDVKLGLVTNGADSTSAASFGSVGSSLTVATMATNKIGAGTTAEIDKAITDVTIMTDKVAAGTGQVVTSPFSTAEKVVADTVSGNDKAVTSAATTIDKIVAGAATGADKVATGAVATTDTAVSGAAATTDKIVAGTGVSADKIVTGAAATTDKIAADSLSMTDKAATGAVATTDKIVAGTGIGTDKVAMGAVATTDKIVADTVSETDKAATVAAATTDKIVAGTAIGADKIITNAVSTTDKIVSAPASGTDKIAAGTVIDPGSHAQSRVDTSVLDTTKIKLPSFATSAPTLDDRGRQLIAQFLENTTQVQTVVTEHSFVIIDMDSSHYTSSDFVLRTWNIGHDVEISIVGLASDAYLAGHAGGLS